MKEHCQTWTRSLFSSAISCGPLLARDEASRHIRILTWENHQSPFGCQFTTRVRCRIMNMPTSFSAIAADERERAADRWALFFAP
jgi:hypothetical protein